MDDNALSAARLALCERIPSPTEISISEFLSYYMPPSPADVDLVVDKLAQRSQVLLCKQGFTHHPLLPLSSSTPNWAAYADTPEVRETSGEYEKDIFADLENIAAQIVECCREIAPHLQPTNELRVNGKKTLSGHVYTSAQPDGLRVLVGMKPSWGSVVLSEEYEPKHRNGVDVSQLGRLNQFGLIDLLELSQNCLEYASNYAQRLYSPLRIRRHDP